MLFRSRERVMEHLRTAFRPEFLNRLDDVVVFHRLGREHILSIVNLQLNDFGARLSNQRITLEVSQSARQALAEEGYDPVYGARPLKRTITRRLETPISRLLVAGDLGEGRTVAVDFTAQGEFVYETR